MYVYILIKPFSCVGPTVNGENYVRSIDLWSKTPNNVVYWFPCETLPLCISCLQYFRRIGFSNYKYTNVHLKKIQSYHLPFSLVVLEPLTQWCMVGGRGSNPLGCVCVVRSCYKVGGSNPLECVCVVRSCYNAISYSFKCLRKNSKWVVWLCLDINFI